MIGTILFFHSSEKNIALIWLMSNDREVDPPTNPLPKRRRYFSRGGCTKEDENASCLILIASFHEILFYFESKYIPYPPTSKYPKRYLDPFLLFLTEVNR